MPHIPVLPDEVLQALQPREGQTILDGTVGYGGHAAMILSAVSGPLTYIGLDRDADAVAHTSKLLEADRRIQVIRDSYGHAASVLTTLGISAVDGVLLDLGASSPQFDEPERGFSLKSSGPLDMRFDTNEGKTAADVLNTYTEQDLVRVIKEFGEERYAKRIAKAVAAARKEKPFEHSSELTALIERAIPRRFWPKHIHPATRTFQALRIEVNTELDILSRALPELIELLNPGGRIAVISFHSLEDRIVKQVFKQASLSCVCPPEAIVCQCQTTPKVRVITKKPIIPSEEEQIQNPRSRSAKLRVAEKL